MKISDFKDSAKSLNETMSLIENNIKSNFRMFSVKTDCGNLLELSKNSKGIKVSILQLENKEIKTDKDGQAKVAFSIAFEQHKNFAYAEFATTDRLSSTNKFKSKEELIKFLNTEKRLNYKQVKFFPVY